MQHGSDLLFRILPSRGEEAPFSVDDSLLVYIELSDRVLVRVPEIRTFILRQLEKADYTCFQAGLFCKDMSGRGIRPDDMHDRRRDPVRRKRVEFSGGYQDPVDLTEGDIRTFKGKAVGIFCKYGFRGASEDVGQFSGSLLAEALPEQE